VATGSKRERGFSSAPTRRSHPTCRAPVNARWTKGDATSRHFVALSLSRMRDQSALIRVARRESFRETVFLCSTPLVIAR
jgi:hypothetical protein